MFESAGIGGQPVRPPGARGRQLALIVAAAILILVTAGVITAVATNRADPPRASWRGAPAADVRTETPAAGPTSQPPTPADETISLSATGDIVMGDAPGALPPNGGKGFFDGVKRALAADLVMGNLEEPITEDTGHVKCSPGSTSCHQFRVPPGYAAHLRDGGFGLLNTANNHAYDFGAQGHTNTRHALEQYGLRHTGDPDEITVVNVNRVRVAVLGFSSYSWSNSLIDLAEARAVVQRAATLADLVVVQVHMGGEGTDRTHVRPGTETFLGENRGDPIKFAHTVIDAGADLVVGHGPHVMRALEFYRGRLIAYSLGNFAGGGGTLAATGVLGYGGVLKVSLHRDGRWASGSVTATTHQNGGLPRLDAANRSITLLRSLCAADFPATGARLGPAGEISPAKP
ncbi:MAG TPA: CapA family protein [Micromonosporaceae bacterium]|jgi:poly-gamma-glutamate capsule biosynthesis protein CapA/YwtB (metallophosphatase superfamily)|nr:CapA family protein [Micromonosporaceae bacterium]